MQVETQKRGRVLKNPKGLKMHETSLHAIQMLNPVPRMKCGPKPVPMVDRFWSHVDKTGECWVWSASLLKDGYGSFGMVVPGKRHRVSQGAHRVSWLLANGSIPKGMSVLHRCDVPRCVRPDHLFLGTQKDNVHDSMLKKRRASKAGSLHHMAKLKESDVVCIKREAENGKSHSEIALQYGVNRTAITRILNGTRWPHMVAS